MNRDLCEPHIQKSFTFTVTVIGITVLFQKVSGNEAPKIIREGFNLAIKDIFL